MPNTVIHEEVGYYLSSKLNKNSYEFYLGLMAPDAINYEKFATKNERWTSHLRCENLNSWKLSLKKFYLENKSIYFNQKIIDNLNMRVEEELKILKG